MSIAGVAVAAVEVAFGGGMARFGLRLQQSMHRQGVEFSDLRPLRRMRLLLVVLGSAIACLGVSFPVPSPWDWPFTVLALLLALAGLTVVVAEAVRGRRAER